MKIVLASTKLTFLAYMAQSFIHCTCAILKELNFLRVLCFLYISTLHEFYMKKQLLTILHTYILLAKIYRNIFWDIICVAIYYLRNVRNVLIFYKKIVHCFLHRISCTLYSHYSINVMWYWLIVWIYTETRTETHLEARHSSFLTLNQTVLLAHKCKTFHFVANPCTLTEI